MEEERNTNRILIVKSFGNLLVWKMNKEEEVNITYMVEPIFKVS
jgi:hypothetical protein